MTTGRFSRLTMIGIASRIVGAERFLNHQYRARPN